MIRKKYPFHLKEVNGNLLIFQMEKGEIEARVYVLEENIFRVAFLEKGKWKLPRTWMIAPGCEDIPYEGRDRSDVTPFSLPSFSYIRLSDQITVETTELRAVIHLDGFRIRWYGKEKGIWVNIANDRKTQSYNLLNSLGEGVYHYLERKSDEKYFGFGEKSGNLDKHGRRLRMVNVDPMGYDAEVTDPLYKHFPFYITHLGNEGVSYGLFYDNLSTATFDMGLEMDNYHGPYRYYHGEDGDLDYYMIYGPSIKEVVKRVSWLTGKTAFPPRWSLGYSGSTMTYTDAPNAQERLLHFLQKCEEEDILCDSFQLSSGYTTIGNKRYVFNWDDSKIPDPRKLTQNFHDKGVRLIANIKPCLLLDHPQFSKLEQEGMFIQSRDGMNAELSQFWDDVGAYLDFTNPKTIQWWKENIKTQLLEKGIDATWNDNNEYEIWDSSARANGFGEPIPIGRIRPVETLLMMKSSYEAQKEFSPSRRPYLISRSGCPGMQRYAQTWSGDNRTSWKTLRYNIRMGIGLSLSGMYNFGHDVGGFTGEAPEPELFLRWVQNGIFHPRFTIHSWNDDGTVNEPWMYPEITKEIRNLIRFRYMLIPYFYQLLYEAHTEGNPIICPTFYHFESDPKTFVENDDFMLGESLLIPSVVEKGKKERNVYLPNCKEGWYDYHTEIWYEGGQVVTIPAPWDYPPLLVKAGTILPVADGELSFSKRSPQTVGFRLFPHRIEGTSYLRFFDDDGESFLYKEGEYLFIHVEMVSSEEKLELRVRKEGRYVPPYEEISFYLSSGENRRVFVNGEEIKRGNQRSFKIPLCLK